MAQPKQNNPVLKLSENRDLGRSVTTLVLVGRIISDYTNLLNTVKSIIQKVWSPKKALLVKEISVNTFLFSFEDARDRQKALRGGPWTLGGNHLVLKEWPLGVPLDGVDFSTSDFWIHVHGLIPEQLERNNAESIAACIGTFLELDLSADNGVCHNDPHEANKFGPWMCADYNPSKIKLPASDFVSREINGSFSSPRRGRSMPPSPRTARREWARGNGRWALFEKRRSVPPKDKKTTIPPSSSSGPVESVQSTMVRHDALECLCSILGINLAGLSIQTPQEAPSQHNLEARVHEAVHNAFYTPNYQPTPGQGQTNTLSNTNLTDDPKTPKPKKRGGPTPTPQQSPKKQKQAQLPPVFESPNTSHTSQSLPSPQPLGPEPPKNTAPFNLGQSSTPSPTRPSLKALAHTHPICNSL
ncbi:hypothetical protein Tsubulata_023413 [Turnera subulata]|uniref:DUF4283 domain-containing protein n=1 Tax=Turnera subulata TaxID=218843 RepID=A0A9Q0G0X9_9ROSI|nr:hypothetical protein Tsubulata_023413 [Turnera subulata]